MLGLAQQIEKSEPTRRQVGTDQILHFSFKYLTKAKATVSRKKKSMFMCEA